VAVHAVDRLLRGRIVHVLEEGGFDASCVDDPRDAKDTTGTADVLVVVADGAPPAGEGCTFGEITRAPVVVVSSYPESTRVDEALEAGASGFVFEADVGDRLSATVQAVAAGQLAIPAEHREAVARPVLSPREKQVMAMVVLGFTNLEIANKLHVAETTVKSHLSSAYRKLRVRSRHEATALILSDKNLGLGILTLAGDRRGTEQP
jgi:DNA-binding NarL/FixJ family response regulator